MSNDNLKIVLQLDAKGNMSKSVKDVNGQLHKFQSASKDATSGADRLAGAMKRIGHYGVGAGAIILPALGVKEFLNEVGQFETAVMRLQATSGASISQMKALTVQARELGSTSIYSAQQAAEAQTFLAQAGFQVNEILSATPQVMQLATAGNLELAQAADIASNVLGGMNLSVEEFARVNDVLAKTASSSNTNIQQLGEALSYAAPVAASAGLSLEETAAAIGKLGDSGIQSSRAGTAIIGMIRTLSNATPAAQESLSNYGLSISDVDVKSRGLSAVLKTLKQANISTADAFKIFGSEVAPAANILSSSAQGVDSLSQSLRNAQGAAADMEKTMSGGWANSQKAFNSALSETVLSLNDYFSVSQNASTALNGLSESVNAFNQSLNAGELDDYFALMASVGTAAIAGLTGSILVGISAKIKDRVEETKRLALAVQMAERQKRLAIEEKILSKTRQALAVTTTEVAAAEKARQAAMLNAIQKTEALTKATKAYEAQTSLAHRSLSLLGRGFSLLGGPVGIATMGIAYFALRQTDAEKAVKDLTVALGEQRDLMSDDEFNQRAEMLKEYRQQLRALIKQKNQNKAVDVLGVKEERLKEQIRLLLEGKTAQQMLNEQEREFKTISEENAGYYDEQAESLKEWGQTLEWIAGIESGWEADSAREREAIQSNINELTLTEAQQRQLILDKLEPENRALQQKLFAIQDAQAAQEIADQIKQEQADMAIDAVEAEIAAAYKLSNAYLDAQENLRKNKLDDAWNSENAEWDKLDAKDIETSDFLDSIDEMKLSVESIGDSWTQTGNQAIDAIGSMVAALSDVNQNEMDYAKQVAKIHQANFEDESDRIKALEAVEAVRVKNSVKGSKDMLAASVAMFKEGSDAQKAAHAIYQAVTAVELGLELQKQIALMTTGTTAVAASTAAATAKTGEAMANATASVTAAGSGDPYTAPLRVAAMTAMMAATLANIGQTFGGSRSGGLSMQEAAMGQLDIQDTILDFEDTAITNRLDQQIELLESIDRNGSVSALEVRTAPTQFENDFKQWRIDFLRDAQFGWWGSESDNLEEFSNYIGNINSMFDDQLYLLRNGGAQVTINQAAVNTPEKLLAVVDKVLSGELEYAFPLQSQMLEELYAKGASAEQIFDAMTSSIEASFTDLQQATNDWALTTIDAINEMSDASLSLQDAYDQLTGTTFYEDKRLSEAYAEIDSLAGGRSYAQFIQDEIENIEKAQALLDEDSITLLLSKNSEDFVAQTQLLNQITEQLGRTFANGAEGVLNYMDSIDLVVEDLVSSADEVVDATSDVAGAWRSLSGSFASYAQIMGTDEASLVAAQKADLQSAYQSEVDAINSVISSTNESISSLKSLSSQLSSAFDSIYGTTIDMTMQRYSAAQAELLQYANQGIVPAGEELTRILGVVTQNSTANYATRADYLRDQALTANAISDLDGIVGGQLSEQEQTLATLQSQLDTSKLSLNNQLEQIDLEQQQLDQLYALNDLTGDLADYISVAFDELDANANQFIDWNEFNGAFSGLATEETLNKIWNKLDMNLDGVVSSVESNLSSLEGSRFNSQSILDYIFAVDAQSGAGLSDSDIKTIYQSMLDTDTTGQQIVDAFNQYDSSLNLTLKNVVDILEGGVIAQSSSSAPAATTSEQLSPVDMFNTEVSKLVSAFKTDMQVDDDYAFNRNLIFKATKLADSFDIGMDTFTKFTSLNQGDLDWWLDGVVYPEVDGSHKTGLSYVPFDGYRAELHEGEAVIDAGAMQSFRKYGIAAGGFDNSGVIAELKRLNQRIESFERSQAAQLGNLTRYSKEANDYQQINLTYQQEIVENSEKIVKNTGAV